MTRAEALQAIKDGARVINVTQNSGPMSSEYPDSIDVDDPIALDSIGAVGDVFEMYFSNPYGAGTFAWAAAELGAGHVVRSDNCYLDRAFKLGDDDALVEVYDADAHADEAIVTRSMLNATDWRREMS